MNRLSRLAAAVRGAFAVAARPNRPTLDALRHISRALHEAGWATPPDPHRDALTEAELERLRAASQRHLRPDDLRVIQAVVADRRPVAEVAAELNRSPADLNRQLVQALDDLARFARETHPAPN